MTEPFRLASTAIDQANRDDPNLIEVDGLRQPLAFVHGELAVSWLARLRADADDALVLAARAHHLRRWVVPRSSYPEGRAGYLRWRKDQKARHAADVCQLLGVAGYDDATIARVQALVRRDNLATDVDAQLMEDVACLVFVETQLVEMIARTDDERMLQIIRKTAAKMTPAGLAALGAIALPASAVDLVGRALG